MNFDKHFKIVSTIIVLIIICAISFLAVETYVYSNYGGYYCEYCHQGTYGFNSYYKKKYGDKPCSASKDSCHKFIFYFNDPNKEKYKYLK